MKEHDRQEIRKEVGEKMSPEDHAEFQEKAGKIVREMTDTHSVFVASIKDGPDGTQFEAAAHMNRQHMTMLLAEMMRQTDPIQKLEALALSKAQPGKDGTMHHPGCGCKNAPHNQDTETEAEDAPEFPEFLTSRGGKPLLH